MNDPETLRWLWDSPQFLKGIGPRRAQELARAGIADVYDLVTYLPRGWRDHRERVPLAAAPEGIEAVFAVEVVEAPRRVRGRFWKATVADGSGVADLYWFSKRLPGPAQELAVRDRILVVGKPTRKGRRPSLSHPRIFRAERPPGALEPIYPRFGWLTAVQRRLQEHYGDRLRRLDPIPAELREAWELLPWAEALHRIHVPPPDSDLEALVARRDPAHRRVAADVLFAFFLGMHLRRRWLRDRPASPVAWNAEDREAIEAALPFVLTADQRRVLDEILADMAKERPMFRLVQGDVGCGKTAVALVAAAVTARAGGQVALLAPTEILAAQHARFFDTVLGGTGLRLGLLTGSTPRLRRKELLHLVATGNLDILVGTHALLTDDVVFHDLRLVVIDEEQRFGVAQRGLLRAKGPAPHTLLLSATPIPRSLALALLGETDVSVIRHKPAGRAPVTTRLVRPHEKRAVLEHIRRELAAGHKIFFLYPRVEEDEAAARASVEEQYRRLAAYFGGDRVGLLHGRLSGDEKRTVLERLRSGAIQILVSTTVIEVGVDVPDATILVIGHPEHFGLSQLHQLRGRIGRGTLPGTCYLLVDEELPPETLARLEVLVRTDDGFEIAEADLELRGAGTLLGTRQSGVPDLHPGLLARHRRLAEAIRAATAELVAEDPRLLAPALRFVREILMRKWSFADSLA